MIHFLELAVLVALIQMFSLLPAKAFSPSVLRPWPAGRLCQVCGLVRTMAPDGSARSARTLVASTSKSLRHSCATAAASGR